MRSPAKTHRQPAAVNMTPMIDVVFLLIIFFLVSSHLAKRESKLPLRLPAASHQPVSAVLGGRMVINIQSDNTVTVAGAALGVERMERILRAYADEKGDQAAVHIRSDAEVDYGVVEPILRAAARAGLTNLTFAIQEQAATETPERG